MFFFLLTLHPENGSPKKTPQIYTLGIVSDSWECDGREDTQIVVRVCEVDPFASSWSYPILRY